MSELSSVNKKDPKNQGKVPVKAQKREKKRKKIRRALVITAIALGVIALLLWGAIHFVIERYLGMINIVTKETGLIYQTEEFETGEVVTDEDLHGQFDGKNLPLICDTKEVKNILLLAVDSRGNNEAGLSDSMILLSINQKTKKVVLCSFLRDILASYPEEPKSPASGNYAKLNAAHAYGGPELTMAVLKETFNIEIDHYVKINFFSFVKAIDAVGGVDLYLNDSEIWWVNEFLTAPEIHEIFPSYKKTPVSGGAGMKTLNGLQALGHARNRRIGSDFARTQRQRDVIQAMATKASSLSLSQLDKLLETLLPMITTNLPKDTIKDMVGNVPTYLGYEIESLRIPGDNLYTEKDYNIIPDLEENCDILYEAVYGEKPPEREVKAEVKEKNNKK